MTSELSDITFYVNSNINNIELESSKFSIRITTEKNDFGDKLWPYTTTMIDGVEYEIDDFGNCLGPVDEEYKTSDKVVATDKTWDETRDIILAIKCQDPRLN